MIVWAASRRPSGAYHVAEARLRTLGRLVYALLLQGQGGTATDSGGASTSILELLARSQPISKAVLLILALFSIVSWSITLYKLWTFHRSERQSASFLDVFRRSNKFSEVQAVCQSLRDSPLVGLFQAGYTELTTQLRQAAPPEVAGGSNPRAPAGRPTIKSLTAIDRSLLRAAAVEVSKLERRVPFLATTASIAPFIGLFGTVWGILTAFQKIGQAGSSSLAVVGPGIAEALIATAIGLFAAIPAVIAYNRYTHDVDRLAVRFETFIEEFSNILQRQG